jgi:hypothetical protein
MSVAKNVQQRLTEIQNDLLEDIPMQRCLGKVFMPRARE